MTPEALADIHAACFPAKPWSAAELSDMLAQSGMVCEAEARGFALARVTLDEAELLTIAISPEMQGHGLGHALLSRLISRLTARTVARVFLEVATDNIAARSLYARLGFAEVGRRRGYYQRLGQPAADALVLALNLGD
ncbi:ribosomal protein S18-alanine N-acetyltransferase [Lentibacter sp. XHP0401]|uniref:ribosomal protein S18-alanine N-acetyltransferase n=1 Tax=Lentibacter sp. XHP0401 TaxID=2984334 RepID=UPI0021E7E567|nr:ribosomal protein S18-alanine N-acetyltransferase [Lentibacter sp. XHP0401]MCV2894061.1 ribosomal protein S18-alanine N-acetyltransferase [Lentibacter sp. XHP0401]